LKAHPDKCMSTHKMHTDVVMAKCTGVSMQKFNFTDQGALQVDAMNAKVCPECYMSSVLNNVDRVKLELERKVDRVKLELEQKVDRAKIELEQKLGQNKCPFERQDDSTLVLKDFNLVVKSDKAGRGNIVIGSGHNFTEAHNGLVVGITNAITGEGNVAFGVSNTAAGRAATVLGGENNKAEAVGSSILGGMSNEVLDVGIGKASCQTYSIAGTGRVIRQSCTPTP